ncbi:FAD-binding oxidoreductase [Pedobacter hartonius]|uniref:FAD/FMN-containing dehydrogenase n=1 Tax=Pedobacter hartonius TaxID=425514 RepID=A0A1H4HDL5_9SPHI|nr:FAD-binding oxidoreductase [Pedobacter hartonius]SEB19222.1 FAD/FMN-containing dehydrogenase [Pedobacter hartonius]
MSGKEWSQKSADELENYLGDKMILPGNEKYAECYQGWAATDHEPAMICLCANTADVQAAVVLAVKKNIPLSVRGGGHDWQGRSFINGGLVIDLTGLNTIKIDETAKSAVIGGGVKTIDLTKAADAYGLIPVIGTSGEVGVAGFTMGGGYGLTSPSNGLGTDNLLSAELVLADGSLVTASQTENPDLLWALCGSGGNFGVVTSLQIRLHEAKPVLSGFIMFALAEAEKVLRGFEELMKNAPDELYTLLSIRTVPDGGIFLLVTPTWYGDPEVGKPVIESIRQLGTPVMEQISASSMLGLMESFAPYIGNGRYRYLKTRWIAKLLPEVIDGITAAAARISSPFSIITLFYLHGKPTRVPLAETAFGIRDVHYTLLIATEWEPEDTGTSHIHKEWADDYFELTAPYSLPGGYPNVLGSENTNQISQAYGSNLQRLQLVKKKFDPDHVFNSIPLAR